MGGAMAVNNTRQTRASGKANFVCKYKVVFVNSDFEREIKILTAFGRQADTELFARPTLQAAIVEFCADLDVHKFRQSNAIIHA
jgi:hypothetical protein